MHQVACGVTIPRYCDVPPYHPDTSFPELPFREVSGAPNAPYRLLRELFESLAFDAEHRGTPAWNPLRALISPGQTVVLKPNFVISRNPSGDDLFAVVTHPSVLRALVDYSFIALEGRGRLIIADVPQMDCDWDELMRVQRLDTIQAFYAETFGFPIEVYDLRNFAMLDPTMEAYASNRQALAGDPAGSVVINLGRRSAFYGIPSDNYYGADYDRTETIRHHHGETHEYCVSKTILGADVFISVPKMKVHKKVGVTLNLKGLVGINTNKNYLIHYRLGTPKQGGDQLPDGQPLTDTVLVKAQRLLFDKALAKQSRLGDATYRSAKAVYKTFVKPLRPVSKATRTVDAGNWHGNDSAWRMTADLAKILFFADADGVFHDKPQRKMLCVVDGIVGGENNGPLAPDAKRAGCLVMGTHPIAVDMVTTRLMGFDVSKVKQFTVVDGPDWPFGLSKPDDIAVMLDGHPMSGSRFFDGASKAPYFGFTPHPGWVGQIEV